MHVLVAVACSASLVHFYSATAIVEDEHSGSELAVCLAAVVAKVVWPGSELVPEGCLPLLLVSVASIL